MFFNDTNSSTDNRDDVLQWARSVAHENGFVAVIIRSGTNTSSRGRTLFVLIGCKISGEYRCRKKEFVFEYLKMCNTELRGLIRMLIMVVWST